LRFGFGYEHFKVDIVREGSAHCCSVISIYPRLDANLVVRVFFWFPQRGFKRPWIPFPNRIQFLFKTVHITRMESCIPVWNKQNLL